MTVVRLPDRLEVSRVRKLIDAARAFVTREALVVDASRVLFAEPYGIVLLAAALLRRERAGLPYAEYIPPAASKSYEFLRDVGFEELADVPGGEEQAVADRLARDILLEGGPQAQEAIGDRWPLRAAEDVAVEHARARGAGQGVGTQHRRPAKDDEAL